MTSRDPSIARLVASVFHEGQKYGKRPYMYHVDKVAAVLRRFGIRDDILQCAAYLHDTLEDTAMTYSALKEAFGKEIADIVWDVTDESGRNRKERVKKTLPKTASNPLAVIVKVADRIANAENNKEEDMHLIEMYRKEWPTFEETLEPALKHYTNTGVEQMWNHLKVLMTGPE